MNANGKGSRVALVTGGTRGIGAAVTEALAVEGVHVAAGYRGDLVTAEALQKRIEAGGGTVSLHAGDIADPATCSDLVRQVMELHGRVDYLISNAGLLVENPVHNTTPDDWRLAIDVNLSSAFFLAQAVLPGMVERGFGRIVLVSSVTALMGNAVEAAYGAAKAGLFGLTRSLARAGARKGVTVNCVVPGVFQTDMTDSMRPESREAIRRMIPLGRRGDPAELAHAVNFLIDDRAAYVTGSVVTVDGGLSMGG